MDTNLNVTPGLGLPSPSTDQSGAVINNVQPVPAPGQHAALVAPSDDASDDLDQEWVDKAKAIVEMTKADPYTESIELSKVKADYLRTRYNKHIKAGE